MTFEAWWDQKGRAAYQAGGRDPKALAAMSWDAALAVRPEERPRLKVMPIVKMLKDQRDEVATVLRELVALKAMKDRNEPNGMGIWKDSDDYRQYKVRQPRAWKAARAILEKCPSYTQQLRNVAEGLGMTYEELIEAVKSLPPMNSGRT